MSWGETADAETDAAVANVRAVPVPEGRAAELGVVVPGAAAQQPPSTLTLRYFQRRLQPGAAIGGPLHQGRMPQVKQPLAHVPVHVMQAPAVGREYTCTSGLLSVLPIRTIAIGIGSVVVGQLRAEGGAGVERL